MGSQPRQEGFVVVPELGDAHAALRAAPAANLPNPIDPCTVSPSWCEGLRIEVDALEAIDGTPVVDVKPAIDRSG
jgi:tRNA (Thr-GGU) A37 N-methylase